MFFSKDGQVDGNGLKFCYCFFCDGKWLDWTIGPQGQKYIWRTASRNRRGASCSAAGLLFLLNARCYLENEFDHKVSLVIVTSRFKSIYWVKVS